MGVKEHELEYTEKIELSEELQEKISDILQSLEIGDFIKVRYYKNKKYQNIESKVLKIDIVKKKIVLENDVKVNFCDILELIKD